MVVYGKGQYRNWLVHQDIIGGKVLSDAFQGKIPDFGIQGKIIHIVLYQYRIVQHS
jgi:hypothetical protein